MLRDKESGIEAVVDFDTETGEYVLNINGEPFETLKYLVSDQKLSNKEVETISAAVKINGGAQIMGSEEKW